MWEMEGTEENTRKMKEQGKKERTGEKERGEDVMWEIEGTGENTRKMKEQGKKERCYVGKGRNRGELRENERTGEKRMRGRCDEGMGREGTGKKWKRGKFKQGNEKKVKGKRDRGRRIRGKEEKGERTDYILLLSVICERNLQYL